MSQEQMSAEEAQRLRDDIELLMARVIEMQAAQRDYFHNKGDIRLQKCKKLEEGVSRLIKQLQARGYNAERFKPNTNQANLF